MNYNHLRYFWTVAREGKLTTAADRLNLSQSALSAQIKKLEHQIGQDLFDRRGRGLALTSAGKIAFDYADTIFSTGDELLARLRQDDQVGRQTLRIGALSTLSRNFQINLVRKVLNHENVEVVVRSGSLADLLAALEAHRLDIVLVNQVPLRDSATPWTARILDEQSISLVGTLSRIAKRTSPDELLSSEPLILPTADSGYRNGLDVFFDQNRISPNIVAEVDDMAMMRVLAREDIGVAVLPPIVVTDELENGRLIEACSLAGVTETFSAITLKRRISNAVLDSLL